MIQKQELYALLARDYGALEAVFRGPREAVAERFGEPLAAMQHVTQNNPHHCYDLMGHTLHAVCAILPDGFTEAQVGLLRTAALLHDSGKAVTKAVNPKTGYDSFHGHPAASARIAAALLPQWGFAADETALICWLCAHHDDFMGYRRRMAEWQKRSPYYHGLTVQDVAAQLLENRFDWTVPACTENEKEAMCNELAWGSAQADCRRPDAETRARVLPLLKSGAMNTDFDPHETEYRLLLALCRADVSAQSERVIWKDGTERAEDSREAKLQRVSVIAQRLPAAAALTEEILQKLGSHNG